MKSRVTFALISLSIASTCAAVLLDLPFLRQILGGVFLTFLSGVLILWLFRLNKLNFLEEKLPLAIGVSLTFVMLFGFAIDKIYFAFGYKAPLSTVSVAISFGAALLIMCLVAYKRNREAFSPSLPRLNLAPIEKILLSLCFLFLALSLYGSYVMQVTDNNIFLLILLLLVAFYVPFVISQRHKIPSRMYPTSILLIGIPLLLILPLRGNHLIGGDIHGTYYLFQQTSENLHWTIIDPRLPTSGCLSITLLPTIYQSFLGVSGEHFYELFYPLIFSVCPLVVYRISRRYMDESFAFLASAFFMFQSHFLQTTSLARINTAIFFFALAILVLFHLPLHLFARRALFIVLMVATVLSHYGTSYIFFFVALGVLLLMFTQRRKYAVRRVFTWGNVTLMGSFIFLWYSQVTEAAFRSGVSFFRQTFLELKDFFLLEARAEPIQILFGKGVGGKTIPAQIEFVFSWASLALIAIGAICIIFSRIRKKSQLFEDTKDSTPFLRQGFDTEYLFLIMTICVLLASIVIVPHFYLAYGMERAYLLAAVVLSPVFVAGGWVVSKYLRAPRHLIGLLVLIPYFLCVSGPVYQVFGESPPRFPTLCSYGEIYDERFIYQGELQGVQWLDTYKATEQTICCGYLSEIRFARQGISRPYLLYQIYRGVGYWPEYIDNPSYDKNISSGYIYLRHYNLDSGELLDKERRSYDIQETKILEGKDRIYVNMDSEIYRDLEIHRP